MFKSKKKNSFFFTKIFSLLFFYILFSLFSIRFSLSSSLKKILLGHFRECSDKLLFPFFNFFFSRYFFHQFTFSSSILFNFFWIPWKDLSWINLRPFISLSSFFKKLSSSFVACSLLTHLAPFNLNAYAWFLNFFDFSSIYFWILSFFFLWDISSFFYYFSTFILFLLAHKHFSETSISIFFLRLFDLLKETYFFFIFVLWWLLIYFWDYLVFAFLSLLLGTSGRNDLFFFFFLFRCSLKPLLICWIKI